MSGSQANSARAEGATSSERDPESPSPDTQERGVRRAYGEIAEAYERRFRQDAVLSMIHPACISFHLAKP